MMNSSLEKRIGWLCCRVRFLLALVLLTLSSHVPAVAEMTSKQILASVDIRIEKNRKRTIKLQFDPPQNVQLANDASVEVNLKQHAFLFGANLFAFGQYGSEAEAIYRRRFEEAMNFATLPYYWHSYQPSPGRSDEPRVRAAAQWCKQRGIVTKGHPVVWNMEPKWIAKLPRQQRMDLFWGRIPDLIGGYSGSVDIWDVVNESTEGIKYAKQRSATALLDVYTTMGTVGVVDRAFEEARKANSTATLILNDYDTSEAYEKQIQAALDRGAQIDVIGIQAHMHQGFWGVEELWSVCERFSKFKKPIHFTEVTILSGAKMRTIKADWTTHRTNWRSTTSGEKRQAREVSEMYHVLFSHPSVEAITWWDMSDRDAWLGAPGGLLRRDLEPKEAYYVIKDLVKKGWNTNVSTTLNGSHTVEMRGFFGTYDVKIQSGQKQYRGHFEIKRDGSAIVPVKLTQVQQDR